MYFLLCHESVNYCPGNSLGYLLGLYHGLVSRFTANNTKALINLCNEDACTVYLGQETLYVAMGDMRHGWHLATPITSVFKVRNIKCVHMYLFS